MPLPPLWQELVQVVLGGNQKLGNAIYWYVEWSQIALLIGFAIGTAAFLGIMSLRILVSGDPEKKKKLKLDMYRPLHSFIFVFLCLVGAQLIWNVFVPTIWALKG